MHLQRIVGTTVYLEDGDTIPLPVEDGQPFRVLYVVRHGEKGHGWDAGLTSQGHQRAEQLALILEEAPLSEVLATDLLRARQTALPSAKSHGLEVHLYSPFPAGNILMKMHALLDGKATLIVGHQNTVPALLNQAAGVYDYDDLQAEEYNRFFIIICKPSNASTILEFTY